MPPVDELEELLEELDELDEELLDELELDELFASPRFGPSISKSTQFPSAIISARSDLKTHVRGLVLEYVEVFVAA